MTWKLDEMEIPRYWDLIKWAAQQVNQPKDPEKYFIGLLKNLLIGTAQCWFLMDEDRKIKIMALTKIYQNIGGQHELLLDTLYGYHPVTLEEGREGFEAITKYAKNKNISSIVGHVANTRLYQWAKMAGMTKTHEIYQIGV